MAITTRLETITPEIAEKYLGKNAMNRNLRSRGVSDLAEVMTAGQWKTTHQGIAFNCDGTLLDGQHRLQAIIESGVPIQVLVTRGLEREAMLGMDQGIMRGTHDVARSMGNEYITRRVAAIARSMINGHMREYRSKIPCEELFEFIESHKKAIDFVLGLGTKGADSLIESILARAWYTANRERLTEFSSVFATNMIRAESDAAAISLKNWLMSFKHSGWNARKIVLRKTECALRAFLRRQKIRNLQEVESELFPYEGEEDE